MTAEVIDNSITEILNLFTNSSLPSLENINWTLDTFEILRDNPSNFNSCIRAIESEDRKRITEAIFIANYSYLADVILGDSRVTQEDASHILASISQQLSNYDPSTHELGFRDWCESIIQKQVEFYALRRQYRNSVRKGLWAILRDCADLGFYNAIFAELENKAWTKVFLRLDELLKPGSAKLSTRLYSLARFTAREWRTERIRNRARFVTLDEFQRIEEGTARTKPISKPQSAFDPFDLAIDENSLDDTDDSTPLFIQ